MFWRGGAFADQAISGFRAPTKIERNGKTYTLAWQSPQKAELSVFEYTSNGEPVEQWTSLITIAHVKGKLPSPDAWIQASNAGMKVMRPEPYHQFFKKDGHAFAMMISPRVKGIPSYESNVQKSFHLSECGGLVIHQYAEKVAEQPELKQGSPEQQAFYKRLVDGNIQIAEYAVADSLIAYERNWKIQVSSNPIENMTRWLSRMWYWPL